MRTIAECHGLIVMAKSRVIYEEADGIWFVEVLIDSGDIHANVSILNANRGGSHKSKREAANAAADFCERMKERDDEDS